jgi:hypothetical protein
LEQTRTDWLPKPQAEGVGLSDWLGCDVVWENAVLPRKVVPQRSTTTKSNPNRAM